MKQMVWSYEIYEFRNIHSLNAEAQRCGPVQSSRCLPMFRASCHSIFRVGE